MVPFGPQMARAITCFLDGEEDRFGPILPDDPVFSFDKVKRTPIGPNTISWTFHKLLPELQLTVPSGCGAAALALPPPFHRRGNSVALVPRRCRSHGALVESFHISGACQSFLYGGLPDHHHGTTKLRQ